MPAPSPELEAALRIVLDRMDAELRESGYAGEPIRMYLAGGLAVNYHCGSRYTGDIDARFSRRVIFTGDISTTYLQPGGGERILYLDRQYNPDFGLYPEDYSRNAVEWRGLGNERRKLALWVLSPIDLAVTKVARLSAHDEQDILSLAALPEGGFTFSQLAARVDEALEYYATSPLSIQQNMALLRGRMIG